MSNANKLTDSCILMDFFLEQAYLLFFVPLLWKMFANMVWLSAWLNVVWVGAICWSTRCSLNNLDKDKWIISPFNYIKALICLVFLGFFFFFCNISAGATSILEVQLWPFFTYTTYKNSVTVQKSKVASLTRKLKMLKTGSPLASGSAKHEFGEALSEKNIFLFKLTWCHVCCKLARAFHMCTHVDIFRPAHSQRVFVADCTAQLFLSI